MTSKPELTVVEDKVPDSDLSGGINCTADSNPPSIYSWKREDLDLGSKASLFFNRSMKREDAGNYHCIATNEVGRTNISLRVNVQCKFFRGGGGTVVE